MSKMAQLNRMNGYSAGDPWIIPAIGTAIKGAIGLFKKKAPAIAAYAAKAAKSPAAKQLAGGAAMGGGWALAENLLKQKGASGGWAGHRRAKGITARELRGYRKVANLLHREGMVSRRARGRK